MSIRSYAPIGDLVGPCETWNQSVRTPAQEFTYIDLSAVDQNEKRIAEPRLIPVADAPSRARQIVAGRDVLVSTVRPNLNAVAVVPMALDGAIASTGFCVLRSIEGKVEPSYLFHWVKGPAFVDEMTRRATGASYPAVSDRIILESKIPLPPLPEQKRIAEILDRAEALRAKRRAALAQLDTLTQSIFLNLFGEGDGTTVSVLSSCAEVVSGIAKGRKLPGRQVINVPYLRVANVQAGYLNLDEIKVIEALPSEVDELALKPGDIVLTEGGDFDKLGRGAMWAGQVQRCIHQNHVFRVRVDSAVLLPRFLHEYLQTSTARAYFLRCAKRTTNLASINMTQLRALPVVIPPLHLQREFARRAAAVEKLKAKHRQSLAELDTLFVSLQSRAFKGQL